MRKKPYSGCVYADGTPGMKPNVPLARNVCAKSSLLSVYAARILSRSYSNAASRGNPAATASTTRGWRYSRRKVSRERYAVVSCHVERPLDDDVWARFSALQRSRPGGFRIAALMRPADPSFGEDDSAWLARAREAALQGPLGHHTHWTAPDHARPTGVGTGARVLQEGRRLREHGVAPALFCGGGWYTDVEVAEACAELGYVDCTPRADRPPYLAAGERWASLEDARVVELPSGSSLGVIPTTHSLGDLARALRRRRLPQ